MVANQQRIYFWSPVWRCSLALVDLAAATGLKDAGAAEVIELTQTGCQFVESEDVDHVYKIAKKAGYDAINARSTN
jgi:hypothetical protein